MRHAPARPVRLLALMVIASTALSGCMVTGHVTPEVTGAPTDINEPFRDDALEVDNWTKRFEGESREVYRARKDIVAVLGLKAGDVVADVGTGTGLFVAYFSDAVGPSGKVLALDISQKFVDHVQARASAAGLTNVEARLSAQADVQLPPASVDVIYVCDTYHHFENVQAILATMRSALRPGGRLVIVDYHRIEGTSRPFIMKHVRAPQAVFASEIEDAGFRRLADPPAPFLTENYLMVFERSR